MPLIHISTPKNTFSDAERDALAEELTVTALKTERLPLEPFDKSTTWIYFHELPATHVYHGGQSEGTKVIALEVNVFEGGLDEAAKRTLYSAFTELIRKHAGIAQGARVPVYVVLREVQPANWGVFGGTTSIEELRRPHPNVAPI